MNAKAEVLRIADALHVAALIADWETFDDDIERLRALAASMPDEGWKLVPVEPTAEMVEAGYEADKGPEHDYAIGDNASNVWDAMLAAAPAPKEPTTCSCELCRRGVGAGRGRAPRVLRGDVVDYVPKGAAP